MTSKRNDGLIMFVLTGFEMDFAREQATMNQSTEKRWKVYLKVIRNCRICIWIEIVEHVFMTWTDIRHEKDKDLSEKTI